MMAVWRRICAYERQNGYGKWVSFDQEKGRSPHIGWLRECARIVHQRVAESHKVFENQTANGGMGARALAGAMPLSYHLRASSLLPSCQWDIARKNALIPEYRPGANSCDLCNALIAAFQSPARYWATPNVFQIWAACGASLTAFCASSTVQGVCQTVGQR
jgi:hypothetical protein